MAPTPFSESTFRENLRTSLIPIQNKTSVTSNSNSSRNLFNTSTRTDVQNILNNSILQANRNFQDFAESHRNVFSNNFTNQLNKLDFGTNKSFKESTLLEPFNSLPILKKGAFFQDPFFEECRRQFEKSVQDIVSKFRLSSSLNSDVSNSSVNNDVSSSFMNDAFKRYRNLRDTQLREENQAASIEHGDHQHKIVIDVKDFMGGDVQVKSFNNTIRIEGHQEASSQSPNNSSSSKRNFSKEFTLPGPVDMGSVNSTLSSDGVLTITVLRSQPAASTARITFPKESDMTQSPSERERYVTINQQQPYNGQTECDKTASPLQRERYVTINQQQPCHGQTECDMTASPSQRERYVSIDQHEPYDGQTEANGATSQNYIRYPEGVEGASCQSYSRNPNGGYWKR